MPDFKPTDEQQAIIEAATATSDNLAVIARAGAGKTSTIELVTHQLQSTPILSLAFNKKIAEEMRERLPQNCESKTLHALGYKAWFEFTRKRGKPNGKKVYQLLSEQINELSQDDKSEAYESMAETLDFIGKSKQLGWLPEEYAGHWRPLITDDEFWAALPMEPSYLQMELIRSVAVLSFKEALGGNIDFDDMIFCPALCSVPWPRPALTIIDEAQDLSPINHHILKKIVKNRRLIAVGDPLQAIYGFRGADVKSMENLQSIFDTRPLYLTVSFRCGASIIENARWRAPDIQAAPWAEPGTVERVKTWTADDLELGDAIICRNNAPLFSLAIKLIEEGKLPEIAGRDMAAPLKKVMKKLGSLSQPRLAALDALAEWKEKELRRARNGAKGRIHDMAECIEIFLEKTETLGDAIAYLDHLLARDGRIYLMTGHKSKGLEFDNVFFLDQQLCNMEQEQDQNLKYVIETRAKKRLTYVTTEGFRGGKEEE